MTEHVITTETKTNIDGFSFIHYEPPKSILHITPDFRVESHCEKPNRWRRFWYRVLLGWMWTEK